MKGMRKKVKHSSMRQKGTLSRCPDKENMKRSRRLQDRLTSFPLNFHGYRNILGASPRNIWFWAAQQIPHRSQKYREHGTNHDWLSNLPDSVFPLFFPLLVASKAHLPAACLCAMAAFSRLTVNHTACVL